MRIPKHKSEQCNKNLYDYLRSYAEIDAARPYMVMNRERRRTARRWKQWKVLRRFLCRKD